MKVYPSDVAGETLPTEEKVVLDHDVALEPDSDRDFYILNEELIVAEQKLIPPFEELLFRARLENPFLLHQYAKKKARLETVTAMFCGVLRLDPNNRSRPAAEVARELRHYAAQHAPRGVHHWRWLLGLDANRPWEEARKVCLGTKEQDLEAQFMTTWDTAPPRVGDPRSQAYELAKECPVRTRLERPQTYLEGISILYWMQRLMDLCGEPWHLSGKDFGDLIGVKQPTAWSYLRLAQADGLLEKTCTLTPEEAYARSESYSYRFYLDQVATTTNTSDTRVSREARRYGTVSLSVNSSLVLVKEEGDVDGPVVGNRRGARGEAGEGSVPKTSVPRARERRNRVRQQRAATPWLDPEARLRMVLSRLKKVAPCGEEYQAHCPAHQGKKQNLTVRAGQKAIVLRCHAGCRADAIVAAMGLQMSDLFWEPPA
jgi:hypothetical protein